MYTSPMFQNDFITLSQTYGFQPVITLTNKSGFQDFVYFYKRFQQQPFSISHTPIPEMQRHMLYDQVMLPRATVPSFFIPPPQFTQTTQPFTYEENVDPRRFVKLESDPLKFEENSSTNLYSSKVEEKFFEPLKLNSTRDVVTVMLDFFIKGFGLINNQELSQQRDRFSYSKIMLVLFDSLAQKYSLAQKSKEDIARFVLRKAITYLRDSLRKELNVSAKAASVALCKKYFQANSKDDINRELNNDNEKEILSFLLPYKKNSRNKTPNARFIKEVFASEAFCEDYFEYLESFDVISEADNLKKRAKFIDFLVKCVEKNSIHTILEYKRLPWPKSWLATAKEIGFKIFEVNKTRSKTSKIKVKSEHYIKEETQINECKNGYLY